MTLIYGLIMVILKYLDLGNSLNELKRKSEALNCYEEAIKLEP